MNLKFKAVVYKYTAIYLAQREEDEYLLSEEFNRDIIKFKSYTDPHNEFSDECLKDILVGLWQADNGFCRSFSFLKLRKPSWFWAPIAWCEELLTTIKYDLQRLFEKFK